MNNLDLAFPLYLLRRRAAGARQGRHGRAGRGLGVRGAAWACGARPGRAGRGLGVRGAAWACCWPTSCALGALGLFLARFDSVLFLSQFLDIIREPGS